MKIINQWYQNKFGTIFQGPAHSQPESTESRFWRWKRSKSYLEQCIHWTAKESGLERWLVQGHRQLLATKAREAQLPSPILYSCPYIYINRTSLVLFFSRIPGKIRNPLHKCSKGLATISCNLLMPVKSFSIIFLPGTTEADKFVDFSIIALNLKVLLLLFFPQALAYHTILLYIFT